MYPNLGSTIIKFLRKELGDEPICPKEPLFQQDFEFVLDSIGLQTEANLQCKTGCIINEIDLQHSDKH